MSDTRPFPARFMEYAQERFPAENAIGALVLGLSMGISFSGLVGAGLDVGRLVAAAAVTILMFLGMRILDEWKDAEADAKYRAERPVPRGLVNLSELFVLLAVIGVVQGLIVSGVAPGAELMLLLTWGWLALMTFEFGVSKWLHQHPFAYLLSHMLSMPFIALLAMNIAVPDADVLASPHAFVLAGFAFFAGMVLEIGRKITTTEREGVETYSKLFGWHNAFQTMALLVGWMNIMLIIYNQVMGPTLATIITTLLLSVIMFITVRVLVKREPVPDIHVKRIAATAVLLVLVGLGAMPWLP